MRCPNCEAVVFASEERCLRCGANLLRRRVFFGRPGAFALTPEEPFELGERSEREEWRFGRGEKIDRDDQTGAKNEIATIKIRWGGFFRRACALIIDCLVVLALSALMVYLSYIGYKVGLSAHGRSVTWENSTVLVALLAFACVALASVYFVMFHGMEGKTIGKWLLGLRVVGAEQGAVTYKRALLRWIGWLGFAPIGLGFLWVLWSREKRAWHDLLARTWVIRD